MIEFPEMNLLGSLVETPAAEAGSIIESQLGFTPRDVAGREASYAEFVFASRAEMNQLLMSSTYNGPYDDNDILVIGNPWPGYGSGSGGYGGGGQDSNPNDHTGDSGSSDSNYAQTLNHHQSCGTEDGAAVQIANTIKSTSSVYGPTLYNWTLHEYASMVVRSNDGSYGAVNSTIYTLGEVNRSSVPYSDSGELVVGIVHNHPDALGDDEEDRHQRYPSTADWDALQTLRDRYSANNPGYDPSVWIIDKWGIMREFKLSERAYFNALTPDQQLAPNGVGLEGRERTAACG